MKERLIKLIQSFLATWYGEQADGFVIEENFKEVAEELYWKVIHEELYQILKEKEVQMAEEMIDLLSNDDSERGQSISYCRLLGYLNKKIKQRQRLAQKLEIGEERNEMDKSKLEEQIKEIVRQVGVFEFLAGETTEGLSQREGVDKLMALFSQTLKEMCDEIVNQKFKRGEREYCIECAKRIRKRLAQKLEDSDLEQEIKKARKDYKEGRVISEEQFMKGLEGGEGRWWR